MTKSVENIENKERCSVQALRSGSWVIPLKTSACFLGMVTEYLGAQLFSSTLVLSKKAGGLGIALAKSCIAGEFGAKIDLVNVSDDLNTAMFSESKSRFLISIDPAKEAKFREIFPTAIEIGEVVGDSLNIDQAGEFKVSDLTDKYKGVFGDY